MLMVTASTGHLAAQGPQYQHSSTCMYALPVASLIARESSGHASTHSVQPSMHRDSSIVTGTSTRWVIRAMPAPCLLLGGPLCGGPLLGGPRCAADGRASSAGRL